MTQPMISGSQRLTCSPVYLTLAASSSSSSFGILDPGGVEVAASVDVGLEGAADRLFADRDLGDLSRPHGRLELAVGDLAAGGRQEPHLRQRHQHQEAEDVPHRAARTAGTRKRPPLARALISRIQSWCRHLLLTFHF